MTLRNSLESANVRPVIVSCALIFGLVSLPSLFAVIMPPPRLGEFGTVMFVNDFAQYEAAMAEGARSAGWLVHDHFTPEPHEPALMFPLYVGLGKLAELGSWPPISVYRAAELMGRLVVLVTIAALARAVAPGFWVLPLLLATLGAGFGVWAVLLQALAGVAEPYGGNGSYELNNYAVLFAPPHVTLGMAATLAIVWQLTHPRNAPTLADDLRLGALTVALCLLHPFNVVSLAIVAGVLVLASAAGEQPGHRFGPFSAASVRMTTILGAVAAPFVLYNASTFTTDPFWGQAYGRQNVLPSPSPLELIVDLGVLGLIGIPVVLAALRSPGSRRYLALAVGVLLLLMYAPVPFQRRFAFGVAPLLGLFVGAALSGWHPWNRAGNSAPNGASSRPGRLVVLLAVLGAVSSPLIIYGGFLSSALTNQPIAVYRADPDLRAAREWLQRESGAGDHILASWDVANYLAGAVPGRTSGGHPVATLRAAERKAAAQHLFAGPWQQRVLVEREQPSFIVSVSQNERLFLDGLIPVFASGPVTVARVPQPWPVRP